MTVWTIASIPMWIFGYLCLCLVLAGVLQSMRRWRLPSADAIQGLLLLLVMAAIAFYVAARTVS